jgi:hypothetical protein
MRSGKGGREKSFFGNLVHLYKGMFLLEHTSIQYAQNCRAPKKKQKNSFCLKIWFILRFNFRLKMLKYFFRKNSSIILVQSRFIVWGGVEHIHGQKGWAGQG